MPQTQTTATPHAPAGHHTVTPYVIVSDARAAIDFYTRAFGAVQTSLTVDDAGKVRHAEVRIGDSPVMLAESFEFRGVSATEPAALGGRTSLQHGPLRARCRRTVCAGRRGGRARGDAGDRPALRRAIRRRRRSVRPRLVDFDASRPLIGSRHSFALPSHLSRGGAFRLRLRRDDGNLPRRTARQARVRHQEWPVSSNARSAASHAASTRRGAAR